MDGMEEHPPESPFQGGRKSVEAGGHGGPPLQEKGTGGPLQMGILKGVTRGAVKIPQGLSAIGVMRK